MDTARHDRSRRSAILALWGAGALAGLATAASAQEAAPPSAAPPGEAAQPPPEPAKHRFHDYFFDDQDGKLDVSNLLAKGGFIPIPIIITEPAVDGGFGLAPTFLSVDPHNPKLVTRRVFAAFKTGNGSDGLGFFQSGHAANGRLSYKVGAARGKITLTSYPGFAPQGIEYTSHYDYGLLGSALWRLDDPRFSIGPLLDFRKLTSKINIPGLPDDFAPDTFTRDFGQDMQTGALGLGFHFDSRDNPLTPTTGANAFVEAKFNRSAFGSDRDYETYDADLYAFHKASPRLGLGLKLETNFIRGDFPVYYAPSIDLRGVSASRYQGMDVVSSEVEATWRTSPRWALLAFAGVGATDAGSSRLYADSGAIYAGGVGFRYRLARKLGLDAGVDVAYGPDGGTFYIQFGHAWSFKMD